MTGYEVGREVGHGTLLSLYLRFLLEKMFADPAPQLVYARADAPRSLEEVLFFFFKHLSHLFPYSWSSSSP